MKARTRWTCALGAGLLGAPCPARAQPVQVALAVQPADAGADATVDAFVEQTTAALMRQVRVLTEPDRGLGNEIIDLPCDRQPRPAQAEVARMRPDALILAFAWRIRANQVIRRLDQPLPVCFPANRAQPDRAYGNVVRFNSEWMVRRGGGRSFVLGGYAQPGESPATLGRDRAFWVRLQSDPNLHLRLVPVDGGCSDVPGEARWVVYRLSTRPPAPDAPRAPPPRPAPCR